MPDEEAATPIETEAASDEPITVQPTEREQEVSSQQLHKALRDQVLRVPTRVAGSLVHRGDAQGMAEGLSRGRAKTSQLQLKPRLLELVNKLKRPSISELHRALLQSANLSYGAVASAVRTLMQEGRLGRVESWPRRYYLLASTTVEETALDKERLQGKVAPTLTSVRVSRTRLRQRTGDADLPELETRALTVARELGECTLSQLHTALQEHHQVSYPLLLDAVHSLERQRLMVRRRGPKSRYVYSVTLSQ